jgi:hypothetical protein
MGRFRGVFRGKEGKEKRGLDDDEFTSHYTRRRL